MTPIHALTIVHSLDASIPGVLLIFKLLFLGILFAIRSLNKAFSRRDLQMLEQNQSNLSARERLLRPRWPRVLGNPRAWEYTELEDSADWGRPERPIEGDLKPDLIIGLLSLCAFTLLGLYFLFATPIEISRFPSPSPNEKAALDSAPASRTYPSEPAPRHQ